MSETTEALIQRPPNFQIWLKDQINRSYLSCIEKSPKERGVVNRFKQEVGRCLILDQSLPYSAQKDASNLLVAHTEFLSLWQNGEELAKVNWSSERKWQQLCKRFIVYEVNPDFQRHLSHLLSALPALQEELIIAFHAPHTPTAEYEKAHRWLYHYIRQYLNPQVSKKDLYYWASQYALIYPLITHAFPLLYESKLINFFETLCQCAFSIEIKNKLGSYQSNTQSLLFQLTDNQCDDIDKWKVLWEFCKSISQVIGKRFTQHQQLNLSSFIAPLVANQKQGLVPFVSWDWDSYEQLENVSINSALFIPYLVLSHHPALQKEKVHWANSLISAGYEATTAQDPMFSVGSQLKATFDKQRSKKIKWILGDFSKLFHDKSERGYSQAYEVAVGKLMEGYKQSTEPALEFPASAKGLVWAINRLDSDGEICCVLPEKVLLAPEWLGVRILLSTFFKSIKVMTHSTDYQEDRQVVILCKGKSASDVSGTSRLAIGAIDKPDDTESLLNCNGFWARKAWAAYLEAIALEKGSGDLFLLNSVSSAEQVTMQACLLRATKKWAVIHPSLVTLLDLADHEVLRFSVGDLSAKAITHFQNYYGQYIPKIKGIESEELQVHIQEIAKFSKQLPVIHKFSIQLQELVAGHRVFAMNDFGKMRVLIDKYLAKIKQLSKGAHERKTAFSRINIQLNSILNLLTDQEEYAFALEEKRKAINPQNIFYYVYYALNKVFYVDDYQSLLSLEPRVVLNDDFHLWASRGKELFEFHQIEVLELGNQNELENEEPLKVKELLKNTNLELSTQNFLILGKPFQSLFEKQIPRTIKDKQFIKECLDTINKSLKLLIIR